MDARTERDLVRLRRAADSRSRRNHNLLVTWAILCTAVALVLGADAAGYSFRDVGDEPAAEATPDEPEAPAVDPNKPEATGALVDHPRRGGFAVGVDTWHVWTQRDGTASLAVEVGLRLPRGAAPGYTRRPGDHVGVYFLYPAKSAAAAALHPLGTVTVDGTKYSAVRPETGITWGSGLLRGTTGLNCETVPANRAVYCTGVVVLTTNKLSVDTIRPGLVAVVTRSRSHAALRAAAVADLPADLEELEFCDLMTCV